MTLPEFILTHMEAILAEWETFARSLPAGEKLDQEALRDHAEQILRTIAQEMQSSQTPDEQEAKSKGRAVRSNADDTAAEQHAVHRLGEGFGLSQMVSEYRALRASVIRLWTREMASADRQRLDELTRFNEGIDQALTESIDRYASRLERSRELLLGVLGHDLRSPLNAILLSAKFLLAAEEPDGRHLKAASRIASSATRMERMISDLLDFTRTRLGASLPLTPAPTNLAEVCREAIEESQAIHPDCTLRFEQTGDLAGTWDAVRIAQVLSNLIENAIRHGAEGTPVTIAARAENEQVFLTVHNQGTPIPAEKMSQIFNPFVSTAEDSNPQSGSSGLGLGLYIVCAIVTAHGGTVEVSSTAQQGTTFAVRLPRHVQ